MTARELPTGSEFDVGGKTMIPDTYAAHAVMIGNPHPDGLGIPAVMVDLDGFIDDGRASVRLILERPAAEALATAIVKSIGLLENLARNQEGPHQ